MKVRRTKKMRRLRHTLTLVERHEPEEERVIRALAGGPPWSSRWFAAALECVAYENYATARDHYRRWRETDTCLDCWMIRPRRSWYL